MNSDGRSARAFRFPGPFIFVSGAVTLLSLTIPLLGQTPAPAQGSLSPSGKFSHAPDPGGANLAVPGSRADAEAALKKALNIQQTGSNTFRVGRVELDKARRTVTLPAQVNLRTQVVEYALVTRQGKTHESLLTTDASPTDVHLAFLLLGVHPVALSGEFQQPIAVPASNSIRVEVAWETNHSSFRADLADLLSLTNDRLEPQRSMSVRRWLYNGSVFQGTGFAAQQEGSIISVIRDPAALVNNPGADCDNDRIHVPNPQRLPTEGYPVRVIFSLAQPPLPPPPPGASPITPLSTNAY